MANAIGLIVLVIGLVGALDVVAHSSASWAIADKDKSFWFVAMFFAGPLFVLPYLSFGTCSSTTRQPSSGASTYQECTARPCSAVAHSRKESA